MVDPFAQSQQTTTTVNQDAHIDNQPAFGGSVDAFDAMSVWPYQPAPLSEDPFAIADETTDTELSGDAFIQSAEDPFVRMGKEEAAPIVHEQEIPHHTDEQTINTSVDPFIVGDSFHHEEAEEATVVASHSVEKPIQTVQEMVSNTVETPTKITIETVPVVSDPVTVIEPPLEPEHVDVSPISEEREDEPEKNLSPLLQKLDVLIHNIRTITSEDGSLIWGIPVIGGNSGVSHVDYVISLDDDQTWVWIDKKEVLHTDASEHEHALHFCNEGDVLTVRVNDIELFHEDELADNPADAMQISDKINKFIFLTENYLSDMRKKHAAEESKHDALQAFQQF